MSIPVWMRKETAQRAGHRCEYCQLSQAGQEAAFHIDHIHPFVAGGESELENLALACVSCSLRKDSRDLRLRRWQKLLAIWPFRTGGAKTGLGAGLLWKSSPSGDGIGIEWVLVMISPSTSQTGREGREGRTPMAGDWLGEGKRGALPNWSGSARFWKQLNSNTGKTGQTGKTGKIRKSEKAERGLEIFLWTRFE